MSEALVRRRLRIEGRVQGVGFRWFTRGAAEDLGLVGWVRNEADGSVLCEVQGSVDAVTALQRAVEGGPRFARVDRVSVQDVAIEAGAAGFVVTG